MLLHTDHFFYFFNSDMNKLCLRTNNINVEKQTVKF